MMIPASPYLLVLFALCCVGYVALTMPLPRVEAKPRTGQETASEPAPSAVDRVKTRYRLYRYAGYSRLSALIGVKLPDGPSGLLYVTIVTQAIAIAEWSMLGMMSAQGILWAAVIWGQNRRKHAAKQAPHHSVRA
jgi:hypothetical protein